MDFIVIFSLATHLLGLLGLSFLAKVYFDEKFLELQRTHSRLYDLNNYRTLWLHYTKLYSEITASLPEEINTKNSLSELTPAKRNQVMRGLRRYFDMAFEQHHLYLNRESSSGALKDMLESWHSGYTFSFLRPIYIEAWEIAREDTEYSPEFVNMTNKVINEDIAVIISEREFSASKAQ